MGASACVCQCESEPVMSEVLDVGIKSSPTFTHVQVRFVNTITHWRWNTGKMGMKDGKKKKKECRDRDLVVLWVNWFFMYPNFHPGVNVCPSFTSPPSQYFSICASPPHLSPPFEHLTLIPLSCVSIFLSWIYFYPLLFPSLLSLHFFPPAVGQCIFNLVSQTSLKARSSKEKFDISFHPIVSRLQRAALWLVDSQLIKPLAVWHPVRLSGRVTLLNEIN